MVVLSVKLLKTLCKMFRIQLLFCIVIMKLSK